MTSRPNPNARALRYDGYRSFSYLDASADYRPFQLASETDRVPPFVVDVSDAEEDRVWRLLAAHPAISLHDHLEVAPDDITQQDEWVREAHLATGYEGLARSGLAAVFENFGDGTATITSKSGWKWSDIIHDVGMRYADWAHQDFAVRAETVADIHAAFGSGRVALIGALEAATPIENELDRTDADGCTFDIDEDGRYVRYLFHIAGTGVSPLEVHVNGRPLPGGRYAANPSRRGGFVVAKSAFSEALDRVDNLVEIFA